MDTRKPFQKRLVFAILTCFAFVGCGAPISHYVAYREPGRTANLGIELIAGDPVKVKINGQTVIEMHWPLFAYHTYAEGTYAGKHVELRGQFRPGQIYIFDIFIDGERAANFVTP
jgi:hypothetical protein